MNKVKFKDLPKEWNEVSPFRAVAHLAAIWAAIMVVVYYTSHYLNPWSYALAVLLLGGLMNHLSSLIHHSVHGDLHPNRRVNDWLARLFCAGPQGQLLGMQRREHLAHHARFGEPDDPERFYYDLSRHGRDSRAGFLAWLVGLFLGWVMLPMLRRLITGSRDNHQVPGRAAEQKPTSGPGSAMDVLSVLIAQAVLMLLLWRVTGLAWGYLAFWAVPLVTFGAGLTVLRATLEHANPRNPGEILFSFMSNPLERFFVAPLQFNYHYEHHRFMSVPYYNAPKLRQKLLDEDDFGAAMVPSYFHHLRRTLRDLP